MLKHLLKAHGRGSVKRKSPTMETTYVVKKESEVTEQERLEYHPYPATKYTAAQSAIYFQQMRSMVCDSTDDTIDPAAYFSDGVRVAHFAVCWLIAQPSRGFTHQRRVYKTNAPVAGAMNQGPLQDDSGSTQHRTRVPGCTVQQVRQNNSTIVQGLGISLDMLLPSGHTVAQHAVSYVYATHIRRFTRKRKYASSRAAKMSPHVELSENSLPPVSNEARGTEPPTHTLNEGTVSTGSTVIPHGSDGQETPGRRDGE